MGFTVEKPVLAPALMFMYHTCSLSAFSLQRRRTSARTLSFIACVRSARYMLPSRLLSVHSSSLRFVRPGRSDTFKGLGCRSFVRSMAAASICECKYAAPATIASSRASDSS